MIMNPQDMILSDGNPLDSPTFFASPVETLLESLEDPQSEHVTLHDLVEAYSTLAARVRSAAKALLEVKVSRRIALEPLQIHAKEINRCLNRDVHRAVVNPLSSAQSAWTMKSDFDEHDVAPDELQNSKDITNVCHYALQVAASMLTLPPLISIFTEEELNSLFDDVLSLIKGQALPTPSHIKTRNIALLILRTQQLPTEILISKAEDVKSVLKPVLDDRENPSKESRDWMKGICTLLRRCPKKFFDMFISYLEPIIGFLRSKSSEHRLDAARALSSFAAARMYSEFTQTTEIFTGPLRLYFDEQVSKPNADDRNHLPNILSSTIFNDKGKGPRWSLVVLACFIALSDYSLFLHPKSLKLILNALSQLRQSDKEISRAEHLLLWRCLIWAFSRIPKTSGDDKFEEIRKRAFNVVRQELSHGTGAVLASVLLNHITSDGDPAQNITDISVVLEIPRDMIFDRSHSAVLEGLALLTQLIVGPGKIKVTLRDPNIFPLALVDGTLLGLKATDDAKAAIKRLSRFPLQNMRTLTQNEIIYQWDQIACIWKCAAEKCLMEPDSSIPEDIINIWKTLLTLHYDLIRKHTELTSAFKFSIRAASIISSLTIRGESMHTETASLRLMRSLWLELHGLFKVCSLSPHAEIILAKILECGFDLMNEGVRSQWSLLCSDLVAEGIPTLLHILIAKSHCAGDIDGARELWSISGRVAPTTGATENWENIVSFLGVPIGAWALTDEEIDIWKEMLHKGFNFAVEDNVERYEFISVFLERLDPKQVDCFSQAPELVIILLQEIDAGNVPEIPDEFFGIVNQTLYGLYGSELQLPTAHMLIRSLGKLYSLCHPTSVVRVLGLLQDGLCLWLKNERGIVMDDEYNVLVQNVYCNALDSLSAMESSVGIVTKLCSFFTSVFSRIPSPGLGPTAFEKYWRLKCQGQQQIVTRCPPEIVVLLKAWGDCCSKSLPESLSRETPSQAPVMSTVTDSQQSNLAGTAEQPLTQPFISKKAGGCHGSAPIDQIMRLSTDTHISTSQVPTPESGVTKAAQNKRKQSILHDALSPKRRKTEPSVSSSPRSRFDNPIHMRRTRSESNDSSYDC